MLIKKLWGTTEILHWDNQCLIARVYGQKGGGSSMHRHQTKSNTFIVCSGCLVVEDEYGVGRDLITDDCLTVPAGYLHRMVFKSDTVALEVYHAAPGQVLMVDDIQRVDQGWSPPVQTESAESDTPPECQPADPDTASRPQ